MRLHSRPAATAVVSHNPFPDLIQTPSGLALLELQGTMNLPEPDGNDAETGSARHPRIGRITFPDYHPQTQDPSSTAWMKRVHLYVGQHQRLTGEVKRLPKALAVIRRKFTSSERDETAGHSPSTGEDELEIVEIVKFKLVFSNRPEPVGAT